MAKYDLITDLNHVQGALQTLSGTTPNASAAIDMQGYQGLVVYARTHTVTDAGTAAGFTMKLQHSDTLVGASFVDCTADDLLANSAGGTTLTVTADTDDNVLMGGVGYCGNRRYVRAVFTGTTATDAVVNIMAIRGRPHFAPVATTGTTTATT